MATVLIGRFAAEHPRQGLNRVGVRPDVVHDFRRRAVHMRQMLEQPGLAAIEGRRHFRTIAARLDQRRKNHRRDRGLEGLMRSRCRARKFRPAW